MAVILKPAVERGAELKALESIDRHMASVLKACIKADINVVCTDLALHLVHHVEGHSTVLASYPIK